MHAPLNTALDLDRYTSIYKNGTNDGTDDGTPAGPDTCHAGNGGLSRGDMGLVKLDEGRLRSNRSLPRKDGGKSGGNGVHNGA